MLFLLVLLLFSRSGNRQPSIWLITVAMALNLTGDVLWGLQTAGHIGAGCDPLGDRVLRRRLLHGGRRVHPSDRRLVEANHDRAGQPTHVRPADPDDVVTRHPDHRPRRDLARPTRPTRSFVRCRRWCWPARSPCGSLSAVRANGRTQADLRLSAQTDALTHLPNRTAAARADQRLPADGLAVRQPPHAVLRRPRPIQEHQRQPRPCGRRRSAEDGRHAAQQGCAGALHGRPPLRRRIRRASIPRPAPPARRWHSPSACCRSSANRCRSARATCS